jgi:glycosyltransferase involved in cell wall biosynthesis
LRGLMRTIDLPSVNVRVVDQLSFHSGSVPAERVRDTYRVADVLLHPSGGEGCGLTLMEAQACGTPPITCQWTAMRDYNWSGWHIPTNTHKAGGEPVWDALGGFHFRPTQRAILQCLNMAWAHRDSAELREAAVNGAQEYHIDRVIADYWMPALQRVEELINAAKLDAVPEVEA